ncbi:hypothetical protein BHM03_00018060 [Ensete ventricosum]|nr:hypothetical protein BHM03_00018060 [Ensete ventricosum]
MLSIEESKNLFALLDAESKPFDEIVADYLSQFAREARFRVCSSLAVLLEVAGKRTARYRAVLPKIDRRRSISAVGGRLMPARRPRSCVIAARGSPAPTCRPRSRAVATHG